MNKKFEPLSLKSIWKDIRKEIFEKKPYFLTVLESHFPSRYWDMLMHISNYSEKVIERHIELAVQGLLEDVRKEAYCKEQGKEVKDILPVLYAVVDLKDVEKLIKKWFPDVVSEDE